MWRWKEEQGLGERPPGVDSASMQQMAESGGEGLPGALVAEVLAEHRERHPGASAPRAFFAPGRVNLMGAHLD